jgi:hypothetical protein
MVLQEIEPSHAPSSLILTLFAAYNQAFFMGLLFLKLERPAEPIMRDFESRMRDEPRVVQCLTVAGDTDYIMLVRSKDVAHYQAFARQMLATGPGIRSYASEVVLEVAKWTTENPSGRRVTQEKRETTSLLGVPGRHAHRQHEPKRVGRRTNPRAAERRAAARPFVDPASSVRYGRATGEGRSSHFPPTGSARRRRGAGLYPVPRRRLPRR